MKSVLGSLVLSFAFVGTTLAEDDPFNGSWKLDVAKSTSTNSRYPLPKVEVLTLEVSDNIETCINDITSADGSRYKSLYTATYNDGQWYPSKSYQTGEETGRSIMMIRMDHRSELRIGRGTDDSFSNMILRMVSEDGKTMTIMWYGDDGSVVQDLHLDKQ